MIALIIFLIIGILDVIFVYLLIYASSKNKTDREIKYEEEEQIKYIKKWRKDHEI